MANETIDYLKLKKGGKYIDATCGDGGHTRLILENIGKGGRIISIDQNSESLKRAKENLNIFKNQIIFENDNFSNLKNIVKKNNFSDIDGIIYDLGLASWQIDESGLGISFSRDEKLDMKLGVGATVNAREIINKFSVKKIADILFKYGDVRGSWSVARKIDIARREKNIETTFQLREALGTKNPKALAPVFQALRIYVNKEYENLTQSLNDAIDIIKSEGRIVVISFHSGEDRIVKNIFREAKKEGKVQILTKKPKITTEEEIAYNIRSRSAKLRAIIKN